MLTQAMRLLLEAKTLSDLANAGSFDAGAFAVRALDLLAAIAELRARAPEGVIDADEVNALALALGP